MEQAELKECPFCGGKATLHKDTWPVDDAGNKAVAYWVRCRSCGSCSKEYKNPEKASEAWNRRIVHG